MPQVSASNFVRFARLSAKSKQRLVARRLSDSKWPGYRPRDDYWVRMRNTLKRLIRSGSMSKAAIAAEFGGFSPSRRQEAATLLGAFAAGWPALGAQIIDAPRLRIELSGFTIACLPHVSVRVGKRRMALRFSYRHTDLVPDDEKMHLELMRLAIGKAGIVPGILRVRGPAVHVPRRNASVVTNLRAEARQLTSLWQANGGPM